MTLTEEMRFRMKEVFTAEEREIIHKLVDLGRPDELAAALLIRDPAQEAWLSDFLKEVRPDIKVIDSKVEKEMLEALRDGEVIDSPEKEAAWQAKLDAEKKGEVVEEGPSVEDIKARLDELGVEYRKNAKREKLIELLTEAEAAKVAETDAKVDADADVVTE